MAILAVAPWPIIGVVVAMLGEPGSALGIATFALCKVAMFVVPLFWHLVVDRQPRSFSPARQGGFLVGAGLGLLISVVIVAAYMFVGTGLIDSKQVAEKAMETEIGTWPRFLAGALFWITINSVLEEFVYRWFLFRKCERLMGGGLAVVASGLLFTIHHVIALRVQFDWTVTILGSLGVFIGGVVWSWLFLRYRSIWPAYLSHAIVDVAVFGVGAWVIFGS